MLESALQRRAAGVHDLACRPNRKPDSGQVSGTHKTLRCELQKRGQKKSPDNNRGSEPEWTNVSRTERLGEHREVRTFCVLSCESRGS
jgi:transposase